MLQRPLVTVKVLPLKVSGEGLCAANENLRRRSLHQEECERLNSGKNNIEDEIECTQLEVMVCARKRSQEERHQSRRWYVSLSQISPVPECVALGATTTKIDDSEA